MLTDDEIKAVYARAYDDAAEKGRHLAGLRAVAATAPQGDFVLVPRVVAVEAVQWMQWCVREWDMDLPQEMVLLHAAIDADCRDIAALAAAPQGEWVMVPREPTEEMTYAARYALTGDRSGNIAAPVYRAMIAAAPPAPTAQPNEPVGMVIEPNSNIIRTAPASQPSAEPTESVDALLLPVQRHLQEALRIPTTPWPDAAAHGHEATGRAIHASYCALRFKVMDAIAALTAARCGIAAQPSAEPTCGCREPMTLGVVHRADGPCYYPERPSAEPTTECTTCGATVVRVTGVYDYPPPGDELVQAARDALAAMIDGLTPVEDGRPHHMVMEYKRALDALRRALAASDPAGKEPSDAEQWGKALNAAAWEFVDAWPDGCLIPPIVWNNLKAMLRKAILKYESMGDAPVAQAVREAAAAYVRDNYQGHTVASLCDAIRAIQIEVNDADR